MRPNGIGLITPKTLYRTSPLVLRFCFSPQPAELRQVRYFQTVLYEERAQVQDELASHCSRLVKLKGRNAKGSIRHLTQQIADKRRDEYELVPH